NRRVLPAGAAGDGAEFDALLVFRPFDDPVDVNAGRMDRVRIELADLDELLDLGDGDLAAGRDHRIEVARRLAIDEVAGLVALPRLDDRQLRPDARLEHVLASVESLRFLAFGEQRSRGGRRVEAGNAGAAGADLLGERSLRRQLQVELGRQHLPLELLVFADV